MAGVAVVGGAAWLPSPGVDDQLIAALAGTSGPLGERDLWLTPIDGSVPWLVVVSAVLLLTGWQSRPSARRIAAAIYLGVAALEGVAVAIYLERMNTVSSPGTLVYEPGWSFRGLTCLTWATGAAVAWIVAAAIDRGGRARGALFLLLVLTALTWIDRSMSAGFSLGHGTTGLALVVAVLLVPLCLFTVALAVVARPPAAWPVALGRVALASSWDVVGLVVVGGAIAEAGVSLVWRPTAGDVPLPAWIVWVPIAVALSSTVAIVAWWQRVGDRHGRPRPITTAVNVFLVLAVAIYSAGASFVRAGGVERASAAGALEGDASFEMELAAETTFATSDARAMVERLDTLGAVAELTAASDQSITLRVSHARSVDAVLEALAPGALALYLIGDVLRDGDAGVEALQLSPLPAPPGMPRSAEGDCSAIERWQAEHESGGSCLYRIQRGVARDDPTSCTLHCLAPPPVLTNDDVRDATVATMTSRARPWSSSSSSRTARDASQISPSATCSVAWRSWSTTSCSRPPSSTNGSRAAAYKSRSRAMRA